MTENRLYQYWPVIIGQYKNPEHNLIKILSSKIKDKKIKDVNTLTNLLYDYARIMDGEKPNDISNFSKNMQEVLSKIK